MMNQAFLGRLLLTSGLAVTWCAPAAAQVSPAPPEANSTPADAASTAGAEEIVVTGIRASLSSSLRTKRNADQVVDAVSAEAIGKLPDQNIAESLQRVTGVQIDRTRGEGNGFQIRGLSQTLTLINGREFTNAGPTRSVELFNFPSELFSLVQVFKSPTADQIEGGLGGTVDLRTPRPLDTPEKLLLSAQGSYGSLSERFDPRLSLVYSDKFANDTLGILVGASYYRRRGTTDLFQASGWGATTGIDVNRDGVNDAGVRRATELQFYRFDEDRKRTALNAIVDWAPTDDLRFYIDGSYADQPVASRRRFITHVLNDNETGADLETRVEADDSVSVLGGEFTNVSLFQDGLAQTQGRKIGSVAAGGEFKNDRLTLSGELAYSKSDFLDRLTVLQIQQNGVRLAYDFTGTDLPAITYRSGPGVSDPAAYQVRVVTPLRIESKPESWQARGDLTYEFDSGFLNALRVGGRYTTLTVDNDRRQRRVQDNFPAPIGSRPPVTAFAQYLVPFTEGGYLSNASGAFPRNWLTTFVPVGDGTELLSTFGLPTDLPFDFNGSFEVEEKTYAGYVRADVGNDGASIPWGGNVGVRVVKTDQVSRGFATGGATPVAIAIPNDYTDVLPSANLRFEPMADLVVRLSGAKVISRAPIASIQAGTTLNFSGNNTASSGNPSLPPYRATQFDLSAEYYLPNSGIVSVAGFYKDVKSFLDTEVLLDVAVPGAPAGQLFDLTRPTSGRGGKVKGIELGYQQNFTFLPAPFDGLGAIANFTYVDSKQNQRDPVSGGFLPLPSLSDVSYNLVGFYEKGPLQARVAYNWRSESFRLIARAAAEYFDSRGQLDATLSYALNERLTLSVEATNILGNPQEGYSQYRSRTNYYEVNDARYFVGLRFTI